MDDIAIWFNIASYKLILRFDMKKLKPTVLEFLRQSPRTRHEIAETFVNAAGVRLSDQTVHLWISKNDPRLTCISVLERISGLTGNPIEELTAEF